MRPLHSKKKRTTLAAAQQFAKRNMLFGMDAADYLSEAERQQIIADVSGQLEDVTRTQFPKTANIEYAILKSHLIVEYALTQIIRCSSYVLVQPETIKFSFSQKLEIAVLFGFGNGCPTTVPSIELLNRLRNQVAHRFFFERPLLHDLVRVNIDSVDATSLSDRQLVSCLRHFCAFICGLIAGQLKTNVTTSHLATTRRPS
jgi:hypothetical protein